MQNVELNEGKDKAFYNCKLLDLLPMSTKKRLGTSLQQLLRV